MKRKINRANVLVPVHSYTGWIIFNPVARCMDLIVKLSICTFSSYLQLWNKFNVETYSFNAHQQHAITEKHEMTKTLLGIKIVCCYKKFDTYLYRCWQHCYNCGMCCVIVVTFTTSSPYHCVASCFSPNF